MLGRQAVATGDLGVTRLAPAKQPALGHDVRAASPVNGPVDAAASGERRVGRIHDRGHFLSGQVAHDELEHLPRIGRGQARACPRVEWHYASTVAFSGDPIGILRGFGCSGFATCTSSTPFLTCSNRV